MFGVTVLFCHYWYFFLEINFWFQPKVSDGCHDLMQKTLWVLMMLHFFFLLKEIITEVIFGILVKMKPEFIKKCWINKRKWNTKNYNFSLTYVVWINKLWRLVTMKFKKRKFHRYKKDVDIDIKLVSNKIFSGEKNWKSWNIKLFKRYWLHR